MKDFEVAAAEISRNFGMWQDRALQGPVLVTHHGRPRVVLLASNEFERLRLGAGEGAPPVAASGDAEALQALLTGMGQAFVALDAGLRIVEANPAAQSLLGRSEEALRGGPLPQREMAGRAGVLEDRLRWVLRSGEPLAMETSTLLRDGGTVEIRAFPYREGVGVVFENTTELAALRRERSQWLAELELLEAHDEICLAELNVLGFLLKTNTALRRVLGFTEAQLGEVQLTDLATALCRQSLREAFNQLMHFEADRVVVELDMVERNGGQRVLRAALCRRMRDEVCEGFTLVALEAAEPQEQARGAA
ncbi:PAS domain-containing protein [Phenylobacterium sp. LjRoot164]|uniref:PAS domain-containing protein n=1 Tax=unclassified Phenylobacterium TaxID=2640670 RepID=UPI003ECC9CD9